MAERIGSRQRRTGMRRSRLGLVLALPLLVAACGDVGATAERPTPRSPSVSACEGEGIDVPLVRMDLDGDGTQEQVAFSPASAGCPASLSAPLEDLDSSPTLEPGFEPTAKDAAVVQVPGRTGQLLLLRQEHPRGGFQAHLFGYADGALEELQADGQPIFPFVATDVTGTPLGASCTENGFTVTQAVAHQPVGVVPAWDIVRTTYVVDGNEVTRQGSEEVADNVLDSQLQAQHQDLVSHSLFENCLVAD